MLDINNEENYISLLYFPFSFIIFLCHKVQDRASLYIPF